MASLPTDFWEILAVFTGLICVWLNAKENVWGWIWGLASVGVYALIFWDKRLYADASLQGVFGASSVYGIWQWSRGGVEKDRHPIRRTPSPLALSLWLGGATITGLLGWYLSTFTPDPRPWIDAALTVGSLAAQYQLARKYVENWLVWIAVDVVYVFLYIDQQLYYTAFLYAAYLGIAVWGYRTWKKNLIT